MIRNEFIFFHNNFLKNYPDLFEVFQVTSPDKMGYSEVIKTDLVKLEFDHINNRGGMTFRDAGGKFIHTLCHQDEWTEVGDTCLVLLSFKRFGRQGVLPVAGVGYSKVSSNKLDYVNDLKVSDSMLLSKRYFKLTDRIIITIEDNDGELPDEFFTFYGLSRREKEVSDDVQKYLDNLKLLDYDAKYKPNEDLKDNPRDKEVTKRVQDFDSRQSKVYIMSKDMKTIIKKTNAMVANHKGVQFGMSALEFRALENKKLFELLEEIGYKKEDVCFARKEIGLIRARIKGENENNDFEVRARFGEINIDDHQFRNDVRYLQNGDIIEKDDCGVWWLIDEDEEVDY